MVCRTNVVRSLFTAVPVVRDVHRHLEPGWRLLADPHTLPHVRGNSSLVLLILNEKISLYRCTEYCEWVG